LLAIGLLPSQDRGGQNMKATYVALSALLTMGIAGNASAATIYWTNWTSDTVGLTTGSAQGTLSPPSGPITVTYSGNVASETNINNTYPSWLPAATYTGGDVGNAPPAGDIIAQNGGANTGVNTITFSQPINDPVMAIWSLGSPSIVTQYVFPSNEVVNIEGGGRSNEYGGSSIFLVSGANAITGDEGNGVIEFIGNYSSITFTNPVFENWYGFTLGVAGVAVTQPSTPEPSTLALIAAGLAAFGIARRRKLV
jgi:hypothetical protein